MEQAQEQGRLEHGKGSEIGRRVPVPKTVAWMELAKSGRGLRAEASIEMLLGGVEVGVALSALRHLNPVV